MGTSKTMAPLTIALGPGFTAGIDVDFVIETKGGIIWAELLLKEEQQKIQAYLEIYVDIPRKESYIHLQRGL